MNEPNNKPRKPATPSLYDAIMKGRRKTISNIAFQRALYLHPGTAHIFDNCLIPGINNLVLQAAMFLNCEFAGQGLCNVTLVGCNFQNCGFTGATIRGDLINCRFEGCDFTGADYAYMRIRGGVAFQSCTGIDLQAPQYRALPVGQFTAYKRVSGAILELLVSKKAQRVSAPSNNERKYRVSKVLVKRALRDDGTTIQGFTKFHSLWEPSFIYEVGKWAEEPSFDPDPITICTRGIHIFLTFEEARDYR